MFIIRNVTRETVRFIIRNVTRETVRFIIRNVIRETAMFIIRKVTRESGNVHYQKRYKGEWEGGITPHSNFTPLGQVPRHSPLVPPTVSTLHLSLDTVHSSLLRCPPLHLSLDAVHSSLLRCPSLRLFRDGQQRRQHNPWTSIWIYIGVYKCVYRYA